MPTLPFKLNQDRRHYIPGQKRKVTNSAAYDAALRQRGSLTVWFPAQLAGGGRVARRARHHCQPRNRAPMGAEVRPGIRQPGPAQAACGRRQVAHGWGRADDLWGKALAVAAVDQTGMVLDILVQSRRDTRAAKRLLCKLLKRQCRAPRVMITDKLASYGAARRVVMPSVEHRKHKGLNKRAENSHQPPRRRERQMKRFKSAGQAQRFVFAHDGINNLFLLRRSQLPAAQYRAARSQAFQIWAEVTGVTGVA